MQNKIRKIKKKREKYYEKHSLKLNNQGKHSTFKNYLKSKNIFKRSN